MRKIIILLAIMTSGIQYGYTKNRGLQNLGNTCYFNASIQSLSHLPKFSKQAKALSAMEQQTQEIKITSENILENELEASLERVENNNAIYSLFMNIKIPLKHLASFIWKDKKPEELAQRAANKKFTVIKEQADDLMLALQKETEATVLLGQVFSDLLKDEPYAVIPAGLYNKTLIGATYNQEDAHEFITKLRADLPNNLNNTTRITQGNIIACGACNQSYELETKETLYDLSLAIRDPFDPDTSLGNLTNIFLKSYESSILSDYACAKCNQKHDQTKKTEAILESPQHLIISLKRFDDSGNKLYDPIKFPEVLSKTNAGTLDDKTRYELVAFICHSGTPRWGHYYAYGKDGAFWYLYDDSSVKKIGSEEMQQIMDQKKETGTPYLFFYNKLKEGEEPTPMAPFPGPEDQIINAILEKVILLEGITPNIQKINALTTRRGSEGKNIVTKTNKTPIRLYLEYIKKKVTEVEKQLKTAEDKIYTSSEIKGIIFQKLADLKFNDTLKILLQTYNANIKDKDGGQAPLHYLMTELKPLVTKDIIKIFRDTNADLNIEDKNGMTPLYLFTERMDDPADFEMLEDLLFGDPTKRAQVDILTDKNENFLHFFYQLRGTQTKIKQQELLNKITSYEHMKQDNFSNASDDVEKMLKAMHEQKDQSGNKPKLYAEQEMQKPQDVIESEQKIAEYEEKALLKNFAQKLQSLSQSLSKLKGALSALAPQEKVN